MKSYKINAVVISRRNFQEKDRVLTLFSLEHGKVDVLAKGARRPGSRLSYISDLGTIGQFLIAGTRSIDIITEARVVFLPEEAFGDLEKSNKIFYALKIIAKFYHEGEPHRATYHALTDLIASSARPKSQLGFLIFLKEVIDGLGVKPQLENCAYCGRQISNIDDFDFNLANGVSHLGCDSNNKVSCSVESIKLLRLLFLDSKVTVTSKVDEAIFEEVYQILRSYIAWHFQEILPNSSI